MSAQLFDVQLGSSSAGSYLKGARFMRVKKGQTIDIGIRSSGAKGPYTHVVVTVTEDAYAVKQGSTEVQVIKGKTSNPLISGDVVVRYRPRYRSTVMQPAAS